MKRRYKTDLSDTDTQVVDIENEVVVQMIHRANAIHQGKDVLPEIFTPEIISMIEAVITDTDKDGADYIELEGTYST